MTRAAFAAVLALLSGGPALAGEAILVRDVEELYAAVESAASAGATIRVARGLYRLTKTGPDGADRAHLGRLELKPGTSLRAHHGATLDAAALGSDSFLLDDPPGASSGVIRAGPNNEIEGFVLLNGVNGGAFIECDVAPAGAAPLGMEVAIRRCVIAGNTRGIDARSFGTPFNGRRSHVSVEECTFLDNTHAEGQGIRVIHNRGATGASLTVEASRCLFFGNVVGIFAFMLEASGDETTVISEGNVFLDDAVGLGAWGGATTGKTVRGNSIHFISEDDVFVGNDGARDARGIYVGHGAVYAVGVHLGAAGAKSGTGFDDAVLMEVFDPFFAGNVADGMPRDLTAIGVLSDVGSAVAARNSATIVVTGAAGLATFPKESIPAGIGPGPNTASITVHR